MPLVIIQIISFFSEKIKRFSQTFREKRKIFLFLFSVSECVSKLFRPAVNGKNHALKSMRIVVPTPIFEVSAIEAP